MKKLLLVGLITLSSAANATLIGDTMACSTTNPFVGCNQNNALVVDPGSEFIIDFNTNTAFVFSGLSVDVGGTTIRLVSISNLGFAPGTGSTVTIGDLDWVGQAGTIVDFGFEQQNVVNVLDALPTMSDITLGADFVTVNLDSSFWEFGESILITLVTNHTSVPEPSTLGLLGAGLLGLFMRRKRVA